MTPSEHAKQIVDQWKVAGTWICLPDEAGIRNRRVNVGNESLAEDLVRIHNSALEEAIASALAPTQSDIHLCDACGRELEEETRVELPSPQEDAALAHASTAHEPDRTAAEREVFNIVHRGLHGTFTDDDLKAAGQDWGDASTAHDDENKTKSLREGTDEASSLGAATAPADTKGSAR